MSEETQEKTKKITKTESPTKSQNTNTKKSTQSNSKKTTQTNSSKTASASTKNSTIKQTKKSSVNKKDQIEQTNSQTEEKALDISLQQNQNNETITIAEEKSEKKLEEKKENGFIKFLKSFTPYQIVYLLSVVVLVTLFSIFLPDEMLETDNTFVLICSVIAVIANPLCELMISKQNKWNFIVSILFIEVTESVIALSMGHIATAVVSIIFWIPIDLVSFFKWKEHPDEEEEIVTEVKKLNWWQDILIVLAICAFGFGVGYLLQLTPVAEDTYWDAFATAFGMANGILLLTRYNEQWFAWGFSLIFTAVAYIVGGAYIMLITVGAMAINTIYGFVKWIIYIKKHKKEEKQNATEQIKAE